MKNRRQAENVPTAMTSSPNYGRRCLITGAAKGIGKALSQEFAKAGYHIVGVDQDTEAAVYMQAELEMTGADALFVTADVTSLADLERLPSQIADGLLLRHHPPRLTHPSRRRRIFTALFTFIPQIRIIQPKTPKIGHSPIKPIIQPQQPRLL